jgi:integrase
VKVTTTKTEIPKKAFVIAGQLEGQLFIPQGSKYFWVRHKVKGKEKETATNITLPPIALRIREEIESKIRLHYIRVDDTPKRIRLSELLEKFMNSHGLTRKESTQYTYKLGMRKLIEFTDDVYLHTLKEDDFIHWREYLKKIEGVYNAARNIRCVSVIFRWAQERGFIYLNPLTRRVKLNPPRKSVVIYTDEEMQRIFAATSKEFREQLEFLSLTGFRSGEACQLQWKDIDFREMVINVKNEKEEREDRYPIDETLLAFLQSLPRTYEPYVLKYRSIWTVANKLRKIIKQLNLDDRLHVHSFRATYISRLVKSRVTESELLYLARLRSIEVAHWYYTQFDTHQMRTALANSRIKKKP